MTTATTTGFVQTTMTVEQARHLVRALQAGIRAAQADAREYAGEVDARVCVNLVDDTARGPRVEIETFESWITAFDVDDLSIDA